MKTAQEHETPVLSTTFNVFNGFPNGDDVDNDNFDFKSFERLNCPLIEAVKKINANVTRCILLKKIIPLNLIE